MEIQIFKARITRISRFFYFFSNLSRINPRNPCQNHFTGTSASVFFSNCQNGATVSIRARSVVVCGDFIVGPRLTTSSQGYLPRMTEHSNPAWSTWMIPSCPNSSLYSFNNRCRISLSGLGSQPPYEPAVSTFMPAIEKQLSNIVTTIPSCPRGWNGPES